MIDSKALKEFYLEASAKGWASGAVKTTIAKLPGAKVITVRKGPLRYVDHYYVCPGSDRSFGETVIWIYDGVQKEWFPVWGMQYGGEYPERMIEFLKAAILYACELVAYGF